MNWITARSTLAQAKNRSDGKPIANNTRLYDRPHDAVAVRLHRTDVVTFHADDSISLNSGGWQTVTTKARMNAYTDYIHVWQEDFKWFVSWRGDIHDFVDGMRFYPDGRVT